MKVFNDCRRDLGSRVCAPYSVTPNEDDDHGLHAGYAGVWLLMPHPLRLSSKRPMYLCLWAHVQLLAVAVSAISEPSFLRFFALRDIPNGIAGGPPQVGVSSSFHVV